MTPYNQPSLTYGELCNVVCVSCTHLQIRSEIWLAIRLVKQSSNVAQCKLNVNYVLAYSELCSYSPKMFGKCQWPAVISDSAFIVSTTHSCIVCLLHA